MNVSEADEDDDAALAWVREEIGINQVLGLYDTPSFARRGMALESALETLHAHCRRERSSRMKAVETALAAWEKAASSDQSGQAYGLIGPLSAVCLAVRGDGPRFATRDASWWRRRSAATALIASVREFNRQWPNVLGSLRLNPVNEMIDAYNRYYILEKECVMGSPRLASRGFRPIARLTQEGLFSLYPLLPDPGRPTDAS